MYTKLKGHKLRKLLLTIALLLWFGVSYAADPYYMFVHRLNPKLTPAEIGTIISSNKRCSYKYKTSMYWHMVRTAHESEFTPTVGTEFKIAGKTYNSEPCYGVEAIQLSAVRDMYPNMSEAQIKKKLMKDLDFAIECSYRLDYANQKSAFKMGFTNVYQNRVVGTILYNAGLGNWKRYHQGLAKYLKEGNKLEDMTIRQWGKYKVNFREVYSLNYYAGVLRRSNQLDWYRIKYSTPEGK